MDLFDRQLADLIFEVANNRSESTWYNSTVAYTHIPVEGHE